MSDAAVADAFDVVIIGAGVVGAAIARRLSHFTLRVALLDAAIDVGSGTSKANTAILHTGFDATPNTLESRLVADGYHRLRAYCEVAGIAQYRVGAFVVAWTDEQRVALDGLHQKAERNGYVACRRVDLDELYRREPSLGPGALGALEVPGESIVDPWSPPIAFASEAVRNGVSLRLGERVCALNHVIDPDLTSDWLVRTSSGVLRTRVVINAAGLASDAIDRMAGYDRFTITARRGQLMVFDKMARPLVNHIVLPVPTKLSKGVLVAPTVFGNVMLGPTAEDLRDSRDSSSTADGVEYLLGHGQRIMPSLVEHEVTAIYAGLRAATEHTDYQFFIDGSYVCVGGIRSTGLTASMSIAEDVVAMLDDYGLRLVERPDSALCDPASLDLIWLGEDDRRGWCNPVDGAHGTLVCHCEKVSAGELDRAMHAVVPARDLEGLRRRTRALAGRCQGFYCLSEVTGRLADATGSTICQLLGTMTGENRDRRESQ